MWECQYRDDIPVLYISITSGDSCVKVCVKYLAEEVFEEVSVLSVMLAKASKAEMLMKIVSSILQIPLDVLILCNKVLFPDCFEIRKFLCCQQKYSEKGELCLQMQKTESLHNTHTYKKTSAVTVSLCALWPVYWQRWKRTGILQPSDGWPINTFTWFVLLADSGGCVQQCQTMSPWQS